MNVTTHDRSFCWNEGAGKAPSAGLSHGFVFSNLAFGVCCAVFPMPCFAATSMLPLPQMGMTLGEVLMLFVTVTSLISACLFAFFYNIQNDKFARKARYFETRDYELSGRLRQAEDLLSLNLQVLMVWKPGEAKPISFGGLSFDKGSLSLDGANIWPLSRWVSENHLSVVESLIEHAQERGRSFEKIIETREGIEVELVGRTLGAGIVVLVRRLSYNDVDRSSLINSHRRLCKEHEALKVLLDGISDPMWHRSLDGRFIWANRSFRDQVEGLMAQDPFAVLQDLYGGKVLQNSINTTTKGSTHNDQVVFDRGSELKAFDWQEMPVLGGCVGTVRDVSERVELERAFHQQKALGQSTIDNVDHGIIHVDKNGRIECFNQAFCSIFGLNAEWLTSSPSLTSLFQKLRGTDQVPVESDFNQWRKGFLGQVKSQENFSQSWYLTDQRKIEVSVNDCGNDVMMLVFNDASLSHVRESHVQFMQRLQEETINHVKQAILVFGADGKLLQYNPTVTEFWGLADTMLHDQPHIEKIIPFVGEQCLSPESWQDILYAVTDYHSKRSSFDGRMELKSGTVLDFEVILLSGGMTMLTFDDQTEAFNAEALRASQSDMLHVAETSRLMFIKQVMQELRLPTKNIIEGAKGERKIAVKSDYSHFVTVLDRIIAEGYKTRDVIGDVEDWVDLSGDELNIQREPVKFFATVKQVLLAEEGKFAEKGVSLETGDLDLLVTALVDRKRFHDTFVRLLQQTLAVADSGTKLFISGQVHAERIELVMTFTPNDADVTVDKFLSFTACVHGALALRAMGGSMTVKNRGERLSISLQLTKADHLVEPSKKSSSKAV